MPSSIRGNIHDNGRHLLAAIGLALHAGFLFAAEAGGVAFEEAVQQRGEPLALNGAGVRHRGPWQVYAAGLYLPRRTSSADEALAMPGAKRLRVVLLREIDAEELGRLFARGVEDNAPRTEMSRLVPGLLQMARLFSEQKKLAAGEGFTLEWQPGIGTTIAIQGRLRGEPVKEPEFFNALLRIWLGARPADARLKSALLGLPPRSGAPEAAP